MLRRVQTFSEGNTDHKRKLIVKVKNWAIVFIIVSVVVIWGEQLRAFAISILAIAAAIVLATKELFMCLSGSLIRGSSHSFSIGDRIEVLGIRGDVIDYGLFTTTILEIGPGQATHQYTGRKIVIPNGVFLSSPVINETFTDEYVLHVFSIPLSDRIDWRKVEEHILLIANEECSYYIEKARHHMAKVSKKEGLEPPSVEPRVVVQITEPGRIELLVRIPVPARRKGRIEQAILRKLMESIKIFDESKE